MTWRRNRTFVLEHHLDAAVLWRETFVQGVPNRAIAEHLK